MSKTFKVGDRVKPLKYWEGEGKVVRIFSNGDLEVEMLTGPQAGSETGAFNPENLELLSRGMCILSIKWSTENTGLKLYGKLLGESGKEYQFAYFRRKNFRGWICSCESFFFNMFKKNRNCKHLKFVREQVGRYGASVK
jgi:hypothetical protein